MNDVNKNSRCLATCWGAAALAGLVVMLLMMWGFGYPFIAGLFGGITAALILGFLFSWLFCNEVTEEVTHLSAGAAGAGAVAAGAAAAGAGAGASADADAEAASAAHGAGASQPEAVPGADQSAEALVTEAHDGHGPGASEAEATPDADSTGATAGAGSSGSAGGAAGDAPKVQPSKALAGEADLDSRKGSWKYEGGASASGSGSGSGAAAAAAAAPAAAAPAAASGDADYDGDGVIEGTDEGTRPAALDGPRAGGADDLKRIKGIGPKLEQLCNRLGFYHFDQIAAWSADEVAWVNANLEGFRGRVSRDNWVEQAKLLAAGEETEFSKRVDKGGVY